MCDDRVAPAAGAAAPRRTALPAAATALMPQAQPQEQAALGAESAAAAAPAAAALGADPSADLYNMFWRHYMQQKQRVMQLLRASQQPSDELQRALMSLRQTRDVVQPLWRTRALDFLATDGMACVELAERWAREHGQALPSLGKGGFGTVHHAGCVLVPFDGAMKMVEVARKRMQEFSRDGLAKARNEHDVHRRCFEACPALVVGAYAQHGASGDMLLEYCAGGDLFGVMNAATAAAEAQQCAGIPAPLLLVPAAQLQHLSFSLLSVLSAVHGAGVLHRDVKPENILLTAHGQPKLADFGVAVAVGPDGTFRGPRVGSAGYLAPEIDFVGEEGECTYTPQSDAFAAGITLAMATAGPWADGLPVDKILDVLECEPVMGTGFAALVRGLTQAAPAQRLSAEQALGMEYFRGCWLTCQQLQEADPLHIGL